MPDPVPFDLAAYCNNPAYPAQLEVCLYANDVDVAAGVRLEDLVEVNFPGYARKSGDLWAIRRVDPVIGPELRSKNLWFVKREPGPLVLARGWFLVARFPDRRQLVSLLPITPHFMFGAAGQSALIVLELRSVTLAN